MNAAQEEAAQATKSTVHDYDYIVPTGGRHYEVRGAAATHPTALASPSATVTLAREAPA